jgi:hypothetical protein
VLLAEGKVFVANRGGVYYALGQHDRQVAWQRDLGVPVLIGKQSQRANRPKARSVRPAGPSAGRRAPALHVIPPVITLGWGGGGADHFTPARQVAECQPSSILFMLRYDEPHGSCQAARSRSMSNGGSSLP